MLDHRQVVVGVLLLGSLSIICSSTFAETLENKRSEKEVACWGLNAPDYSFLKPSTRARLLRLRRSIFLTRKQIKRKVDMLSRKGWPKVENIMATLDFAYVPNILSLMCPKCGSRTLYYSEVMSCFWLEQLYQQVQSIRMARPTLDVVLDTTFLCPSCNPHVIQKTELAVDSGNQAFPIHLEIVREINQSESIDSFRWAYGKFIDRSLRCTRDVKGVKSAVKKMRSALMVKKEFSEIWPRDSDWLLLIRYPGEANYHRVAIDQEILDFLFLFVTEKKLLRLNNSKHTRKTLLAKLCEILNIKNAWKH